MAISTATATGTRCVHHYVFETPNGPLARGACKHCGEVKHSPNVCLLDRDGSTWKDFGTPRGEVEGAA